MSQDSFEERLARLREKDARAQPTAPQERENSSARVAARRVVFGFMRSGFNALV